MTDIVTFAFDNGLDEPDTTVGPYGGSVVSRAMGVSDDAFRLTTTYSFIVDLPTERSIKALSLQFARATYPFVSDDNPATAENTSIAYRVFSGTNRDVLAGNGSWTANAVPGYMQTHHILSSPLTGNRVRFELSSTGRSGDSAFVDIEHVGVYQKTETAPTGLSYPSGFGWTPQNDSSKSTAGRSYINRYAPWRKWSLVLEQMDVSQSSALSEMTRIVGASRRMLVVRDDLPTGRQGIIGLVNAAQDFDYVTPTLLNQTLTVLEDF